jgi:hypothetical protein
MTNRLTDDELEDRESAGGNGLVPWAPTPSDASLRRLYEAVAQPAAVALEVEFVTTYLGREETAADVLRAEAAKRRPPEPD